MYLKQRYKIWGSWIFGIVVFGCSLVLTPRIWVDSSASTTDNQIPVQAIQPFDTPTYTCTNCDNTPNARPCLTDRMPEHPIIWNNSDQLSANDYENCEPQPSNDDNNSPDRL